MSILNNLGKLGGFSMDFWSWWRQSTNVDDGIFRIILSLSIFLDDGIFRIILSLSIFLAISWYTMIFTKSSTNRKLPPGPRGLPLVGNLPFLDPELHSYFASLARTYGSILTLRLGMKVCFVVSSHAVAREVLKDHDTIFANRDPPAATKASGNDGIDIVWTSYGPVWRMLRKVCMRDMLGNATLDAVYDIRKREMQSTIGYFYKRAGTPVYVGEQMFLTVLNVITSMLWGGTVQGKERAAIGAEFRLAVAELTSTLGKPNVSDFFPFLTRFDLQGIQQKNKDMGTKFDQIFEKVINQRVKMGGAGENGGGYGGKESKDFLQVLLQLKDEKHAKVPLTMAHLKALLLDMVIGGTDTTSNTVEFAMAEVMNKQEVMKKAQQELEMVVGKDNKVEESHFHKLPYINAIMKEVLRLHPALPLMVPHCPNESSIIAGYDIPKGTRIFVNVWAIHRDPSVWENPLEFYPDRFLNGKGDYTGNDFSYIPFGSGRRICAGLAMAERVLLFTLASLLHSFDWKLVEGETMDLTEKFGIVLRKKNPLVAIPTPRLSNPELYKL